MFIAPTTPIELDGQIFDRYMFSLATTTRYNDSNTLTGSVALRFTPVRIAPDGEVISAPSDFHKLVSVGDVATCKDPTLRDTAIAIANIMQSLIQTKGF